MSLQRTLSIIKPDGVKRRLIGKIVNLFEENKLKVAAAQMKILSRHEAEGFYAVHRERPFFGELVEYMCSSAVLILVLEGEDSIKLNRKIMGATNPADATDGTIRKLFGLSIGENTVHGSDSPETAEFEISWFFPAKDIFPTSAVSVC